MSKLRKFLAAGLAVGLLVTSMLAGCSKTASTGNQSSTSNPTAQTVEKKLDPVSIVWIIRNAEPKNFASVMAKVNSILKDKLNVTLEIKCMENTQYADKIPVMFASGENMDIVWANATTPAFNYPTAVPNGAFLELDALLAKYAPTLLTKYPQGIWDALKINGKIYAIPGYQKEFSQKCFEVNKDLLDKYKIDINTLKTKDGLYKALQTVKDGEKSFPLISGNISNHFNLKKSTDQGIFAATVIPNLWVDTKTWKVIPPNDPKDPMVENYAMSRELYQKGFVTPDALTIKDPNTEFKSKKYFLLPNAYKPGGDADYTNLMGFPIQCVALDDPFVDTTSVQGTLSCIAKASKNPDRAVMLLNLVHTDKDLYNLLIFGIEGQDYTKTGPDSIEPVKGAYSLPAWMMGNQFNAFKLPGQAADLWTVTEDLNRKAPPYPLNGFTFDPTNVKTELANVTASNTEFGTILANGMDDPVKTYAAMIAKAKQGGYDKLIAEYQKQLDAWVIASGKKK